MYVRKLEKKVFRSLDYVFILYIWYRIKLIFIICFFIYIHIILYCKMRNVIFHTLNGIRGWSTHAPDSIDVSRVSSIKFEQRLFKIFNREYDYTVKIVYDEPYTTYTFVPVSNGGSTAVPITYLTKTITRRFITLDDARREVDIVKKHQEKLDAYMNKVRNEIEIFDKM